MWAQSDLRRRWLSLLVVALFIAFASGTTMALVAGAQRAGLATERFSTTSGLSELLAFVGQDPSDTSSAGREQTVAELVRALADDPDVTRFQRPNEWPQLRTCWHPGWAAARTRPATALRTERVLLIGVRHHE